MRWTLATGITVARLGLLPPVIFLFVGGWRLLAFVVLLVVLLLDLADGALARSRREVTELGRILDPLVDKLVFLTLFALLVWVGELPWPPLVLLALLQGGIVVGGLFWWRLRRDAPPPRLLGKVASFGLSLGLLSAFLLIPHYTEIVYGGVALAYLAGLDYLFNFLRALRSLPCKAGKERGEGP